MLLHYAAVSGSNPRCFPSGKGEREDGAAWGGCEEVNLANLLVTTNIKLLYKARVDKIKGLTEQNDQSGFIMKGLSGVGGRQR